MTNEQHIFKPLIGTWRTSGQIRATDTSLSIMLSGTDTYEWLINESIILHLVDVKLGEDDIKSAEVIGPNTNSQGYFMHSYNPNGELEVTKATIKDGVYLFEGKTARFKGGFSEDSIAFSGLWEQLQGDDWQPWMDLRLEKEE